MGKFRCKNCGYKFGSNMGYTPKKCPYCNKESVEEEKDAEELIKEVESLLE